MEIMELMETDDGNDDDIKYVAFVHGVTSTRVDKNGKVCTQILLTDGDLLNDAFKDQDEKSDTEVSEEEDEEEDEDDGSIDDSFGWHVARRPTATGRSETNLLGTYLADGLGARNGGASNNRISSQACNAVVQNNEVLTVNDSDDLPEVVEIFFRNNNTQRPENGILRDNKNELPPVAAIHAKEENSVGRKVVYDSESSGSGWPDNSSEEENSSEVPSNSSLSLYRAREIHTKQEKEVLGDNDLSEPYVAQITAEKENSSEIEVLSNNSLSLYRAPEIHTKQEKDVLGDNDLSEPYVAQNTAEKENSSEIEVLSNNSLSLYRAPEIHTKQEKDVLGDSDLSGSYVAQNTDENGVPSHSSLSLHSGEEIHTKQEKEVLGDSDLSGPSCLQNTENENSSEIEVLSHNGLLLNPVVEIHTKQEKEALGDSDLSGPSCLQNTENENSSEIEVLSHNGLLLNPVVEIHTKQEKEALGDSDLSCAQNTPDIEVLTDNSLSQYRAAGIPSEGKKEVLYDSDLLQPSSPKNSAEDVNSSENEVLSDSDSLLSYCAENEVQRRSDLPLPALSESSSDSFESENVSDSNSSLYLGADVCTKQEKESLGDSDLLEQASSENRAENEDSLENLNSSVRPVKKAKAKALKPKSLKNARWDDSDLELLVYVQARLIYQKRKYLKKKVRDSKRQLPPVPKKLKHGAKINKLKKKSVDKAWKPPSGLEIYLPDEPRMLRSRTIANR